MHYVQFSQKTTIFLASPSPQSVTYDLKTPVSYKPTLTMDLLENVYVVSSADSRDALRREQSVIWSLLTSISVFIIRLL
ncbi:hypothetical protein DPMN_101718 [Dreissena polymorpha]|uniref:Uncharacterized protein n=1 Tax=Dreissena polymorpha TaxID=45954 RepID=A0A9D4LI20_DREPO|nr:hypothetical protein DPMN_101718 [Dreissena polymorpha]